jgi:GSPII_E N-terminal domain.
MGEIPRNSGAVSRCTCALPALFPQRRAGHNSAMLPASVRDSGSLTLTVPISQVLYTRLNTLLTVLCTPDGANLHFPAGAATVQDLSAHHPLSYLSSLCSTSVSVLVLHIVQSVVPSRRDTGRDTHSIQRQYMHVSAALSQQVIDAMLRVLRLDDRMFVHEESGAAFVFPGVEQVGMQRILERIFASVSLLDGETLDPPLTRETHIVLGCGTYQRSVQQEVATAQPFLSLYHQIGCAAHHLLLRPALRAPVAITLPLTLPDRLTALIPCVLARELQCVPVGYEYRRLTVALLDPTNEALIERLRRNTGYIIYPVLCREEELTQLLTRGW